jgi:hypothetical protein
VVVVVVVAAELEVGMGHQVLLQPLILYLLVEVLEEVTQVPPHPVVQIHLVVVVTKLLVLVAAVLPTLLVVV